jgi:spore germination protein Q
MDRNNLPPNYYGSPYPPQMDMNSYPNMGVNPPYPTRAEQTPNNPQTNTTYETNQYYFTKYLNEHIGKNVTVYCSFTDSADWHDKIFKGKVTGAGDDYLIVDEITLNKEVLILSVYIHFVEFDK